jgi:hypothetical protein
VFDLGNRQREFPPFRHSRVKQFDLPAIRRNVAVVEFHRALSGQLPCIAHDAMIRDAHVHRVGWLPLRHVATDAIGAHRVLLLNQ